MAGKRPTWPAPRQWAIPAIIGLIAALVGSWLGSTTRALEIEQDVGLRWLYALRGPTTPPDNVVVVTLDVRSAERISLPADTRGFHGCTDIQVDALDSSRRALPVPLTGRWPRCLHARLIDILTEAGASAVMFDLTFRPRPPMVIGGRDLFASEDLAMATAMKRASNVILVQNDTEAIGGDGPDACRDASPVVLSTVIQSAALGSAPFLTEPDARVERFPWFNNCAWPAPNFPMLALQALQKDAYRELRQELINLGTRDGTFSVLPERHSGDPDVRIVEAHRGLTPDSLPELDKGPLPAGQLESAVAQMRTILKGPLGKELERRSRSRFAEQLRLLYAGPDTRYFNHYGPRGTIPHWSYADVLATAARAPEKLRESFANRAVFVGMAEMERLEKTDHHQTVFEPKFGVSGVELAATAYANLSENSSVVPLQYHAAIAGLTTFVALVLTLVFPALWGILGAGMLVGAYVLASSALFSSQALWLPVAIVAFAWGSSSVGGLMYQYVSVSRRQRRLMTVVETFVPKDVARKLVQPQGYIPTNTEAIVIATDIANYTSLSEGMSPKALQELMAQYFELVFRPVMEHGGFISDIVGDAMVAIWPAAPDGTLPREAVLDACVDIQKAIAASPIGDKLPTRIGVTSGPVTLAMVGALDHYEFRAVGDPVNTANRVQGHNKDLGTRVLVSSEMLEGIDRFDVVDRGEAKLRNKAVALRLFELRGRKPQADPPNTP